MKIILLALGLTAALPAWRLPAEAAPSATVTPPSSPTPRFVPGHTVITRLAPRSKAKARAARARRFRHFRQSIHLTPQPTLPPAQVKPDATARPGSGPLP